MRWVMKVTRSVNQFRITLPGTFCKIHNITETDYMVIDDRETDKITIGRLDYGDKKEAERKGRQA